MDRFAHHVKFIEKKEHTWSQKYISVVEAIVSLHSALCLIPSTNRMRERGKDGGGEGRVFSRMEIESDSTQTPQRALVCAGAGDLGMALFSMVLVSMG